MIDVSALGAALDLLSSSWQPWLVVFPGLLIGLLFHAIPGLTTSMAIAICLPIIPYMDFLSALIFMTAMYTGSLFGVAIPAVLLNIPGSPAAVATTFDGFPMAQAGRHDEALGYALAASSVGQGLAYLLLLLLVQPIAEVAIKLGPPEMLVVALWGLTLIATLRGRHVARGLLAGAFGLLLGTIGLSSRGAIRGTMGLDVLLDGIPVVPALIGLFAAAELFNLTRSDYIVAEVTARTVRLGRILRGVLHTFKYPGVLLRGSLIGTVIGTLPGGHAVANLLSYSEARRAAKDPESFGCGDPRGVIAAEAGNASSEGGSMATLLALGIPTGGATAIMLIAFDMHNITGGPQFMHDHKDLVYAVILSNLAQVVILMFVGLAFIFAASYVIKVRIRALIPIVLSLAVIGSYVLAQNMAGPITLFVFSVIGWLMQRFDYPVAATVVGLLLSRLTEGALLRTYQLSGGDPAYLLERPVALGFLLLLILSLLLPAVRAKLGTRHTEAGSPGHG
jgi:putative tricarboxylic transport membrane protein